jgi:hypothetical protein
MMPRPNPAPRVLLAASVAAALGGCLDLTPITLAPADGGAQDVSTVVTLEADVDAGQCEPCVQSAKCSTEFERCISTPKCSVMFQCGLSQGCYAPGANLVSCLTICGQQAGLTGQNDPAVDPFLDLYACATTKCAASCATP